MIKTKRGPRRYRKQRVIRKSDYIFPDMTDNQVVSYIRELYLELYRQLNHECHSIDEAIKLHIQKGD